MLEYNLIKAHRPRFNIRLVDDKSYPYLAVTVGDEWPKATVMRGARRKDTRYFGPYAHAYAIRETLDSAAAVLPDPDLLGRQAPPPPAPRSALPALPHRTLLGPLRRCCRSRGVRGARLRADGVPRRRHEAGRRAPREPTCTRRPRSSSSSGRRACETAWRRSGSPSSASRWSPTPPRTSTPSPSPRTSWSPPCRSSTYGAGASSGRHGFIVEKVEPLTSSQLVARVLEQHYAETPIGIPRELLVPELPEDVATYEEWLCGLRPGKVTVRVPKRGRKRELLATARHNAEDQLKRHRLRRATRPHEPGGRPRGAPGRARAQGGAAADRVLRHEPHPGTDYVGSMVVFEDGLPKRSDYRRFKVSAVQGNDDYGAMHEVLTRRLRRLLEAGPNGAEDTDATAVAPDAELPPEPGPGEDARCRVPDGRRRRKAALCLPASAAPPRRWQRTAQRRRERVSTSSA